MDSWYRPLAWWQYPLLPLSYLFGMVTALRRWCYARGLVTRYRSALPVIVVGNVSVGGTGKTPVVIWLVEQLQAQGWTVGVVSRGYGGTAPHYPWPVNAETPTAEAGDEPVLIAQRCGCPVVVDPCRTNAVRYLEQHSPVDLIISDDGLQHYALDRTLEIVVIDGQRRLGNGQLLPAGPLREHLPPASATRFFICNGGTPQPEEWLMTLEPQAAKPLTPQGAPLDTVPVHALAGIGHPQRFFDQLRQNGYNLLSCHPYPDHHAFSAQALRDKFGEAPLVMTEKDAVKCRSFSLPHWYYIPVDAAISPSLMSLLSQRLQEAGFVPQS